MFGKVFGLHFLTKRHRFLQQLQQEICNLNLRICSCEMSSLVDPRVPVNLSDTDDDHTPETVPVRRHLPLITSRTVAYPSRYRPTKQAWLESLETADSEKLGILDLHPDVFATFPRLDILHNNIMWQRFYRFVDYRKPLNRAEMRGGGRKPWPQKKTGRARHGSIRSPLWHNGGVAHGPRGPKTYFYMLPMQQRALGLRVALSVKYAQNDLHIIDSLEIPDDDPQYLEDLAQKRNWGYSVLFVDDCDYLPRNVSLALESLKSFNAMPVYGLNVFSMLKHETLVLTLAAVEKLELKLLHQMHKNTPDPKFVMTRRFIKEPFEAPDYPPPVKRPFLYPD